MIPSQLILKNGTMFAGRSPFWQKNVITNGEVVFTTGMTGYVESLTDPSYAGQIIVFTYPLIGNYGVPAQEYWESLKIYAQGVIVSEACEHGSHRTLTMSLEEWLKEQHVPLLSGVDTRALTLLLRESGTMKGTISTQNTGTDAVDAPLTTDISHLVRHVSPKEKRTYGQGPKKIIAVDCGMKESMLRSLIRDNVTVTRVPFDYDYSNDAFDALFLSNGPGDPEACADSVGILARAMRQKKPIFGVCLGSQIMALAAGAKTYKLPYGHRGHNQPCQNQKTKHCVITSQNHGYAVRDASLPSGWHVTYRNLNDGSVEGIAHKKLPFFSVQFHPEGNPGPHDSRNLFDQFYALL